MKLKPEAIRMQTGLSLDEFCKRLGISRQTYLDKRKKKRKWYVTEVVKLKEIGNLDSYEDVDLS